MVAAPRQGMERNPARVVRHFESDDICAAAPHLARQESTRRANLKDAFPGKPVPAKIGVDLLAQVPLPTDNTVVRYVDGVVE